jgi:hypothetical protein
LPVVGLCAFGVTAGLNVGRGMALPGNVCSIVFLLHRNAFPYDFGHGM